MYVCMYVYIRVLHRFGFTRTEPNRPKFDPVRCENNRNYPVLEWFGVTITEIIPVWFKSV